MIMRRNSTKLHGSDSISSGTFGFPRCLFVSSSLLQNNIRATDPQIVWPSSSSHPPLLISQNNLLLIITYTVAMSKYSFHPHPHFLPPPNPFIIYHQYDHDENDLTNRRPAALPSSSHSSSSSFPSPSFFFLPLLPHLKNDDCCGGWGSACSGPPSTTGRKYAEGEKCTWTSCRRRGSRRDTDTEISTFGTDLGDFCWYGKMNLRWIGWTRITMTFLVKFPH